MFQKMIKSSVMHFSQSLPLTLLKVYLQLLSFLLSQLPAIGWCHSVVAHFATGGCWPLSDGWNVFTGQLTSMVCSQCFLSSVSQLLGAASSPLGSNCCCNYHLLCNPLGTWQLDLLGSNQEMDKSLIPTLCCPHNKYLLHQLRHSLGFTTFHLFTPILGSKILSVASYPNSLMFAV